MRSGTRFACGKLLRARRLSMEHKCTVIPLGIPSLLPIKPAADNHTTTTTKTTTTAKKTTTFLLRHRQRHSITRAAKSTQRCPFFSCRLPPARRNNPISRIRLKRRPLCRLLNAHCCGCARTKVLTSRMQNCRGGEKKEPRMMCIFQSLFCVFC